MSRAPVPMKMDDYIPRNPALQFINSCLAREDRKLQSAEKATLLTVKRVIEAIPPADVLQVVRCRDCKHYFAYPSWVSTCHEHYGIGELPRRVSPDSFCSFGERREDDGE